MGRKERLRGRERIAWKHTHYICEIDSQWEFACDSGSSDWGPVTTQRGGMGREVREGGDTYTPMANSR